MPRKYLADGQSAGDLFPHLLEEFHPTKNGSLSLFDVARVSGKRAYWICKV